MIQGTPNNSDIWDSHGLITIALFNPPSKCSPATDTWIQTGTRAMIQTASKSASNAKQELFLLLPSMGRFAEFDLMPGKVNGEIVWMASPAQGIPGPGSNTYDYFVEFGVDPNHPDEKLFRFDVFPHWDPPPKPGDPNYPCYQERPDQRTDWAHTSPVGPTQTTTGTGNEPVH